MVRRQSQAKLKIRHDGRLIAHRTEQWNPVFGQIRCANKNESCASVSNLEAAALAVRFPTYAFHLPQLRLQMLKSQEPRETLNLVELKNLTFENELSASDRKAWPRESGAGNRFSDKSEAQTKSWSGASASNLKSAALAATGIQMSNSLHQRRL
jgi:hypothetical protein